MNSKIIILLLLASLVVISCSSCKQEDSKTSKNIESNSSLENLTFEGRIAIVGNEPFPKLGLVIDDSTIYILEGDKNMEDTLKNNQGQFYTIYAKEKITTESGTKLLLNKIEKIN